MSTQPDIDWDHGQPADNYNGFGDWVPARGFTSIRLPMRPTTRDKKRHRRALRKVARAFALKVFPTRLDTTMGKIARRTARNG